MPRSCKRLRSREIRGHKKPFVGLVAISRLFGEPGVVGVVLGLAVLRRSTRCITQARRAVRDTLFFFWGVALLRIVAGRLGW